MLGTVKHSDIAATTYSKNATYNNLQYQCFLHCFFVSCIDDVEAIQSISEVGLSEKEQVTELNLPLNVQSSCPS